MLARHSFSEIKRRFASKNVLIALLITAGMGSVMTQPITPSGIAVNTTSDQPQNSKNDSIKAVHDLIGRVLPAHASSFACELIPDEKGRDVFEIESTDGKIILRGNNGISLASAFNWYLKYDAKVSYDWQAITPLEINGTLPRPTGKTRQSCLAKERFFLNYCTYGYTFPYADFPEWQRFFDWLAMNGVNRPLVHGGQEAIWLNVWKSYGLTEDQILSYFTAPAHLAWHRMANIDKWGSPLPLDYIQKQQDIQTKLIQQARILGMKPILSGFSGHVPEVLKTVRPEAKITPIKPWGGFVDGRTWFLDPTDPLFNDIQKRFIQEQTRLYGTDHLYAADPFNEIDPPSWEVDYMNAVAGTISQGMTAGDPDAIWYQMGWTYGYDRRWLKKDSTGKTPLEGMTAAVPQGKIVFLDYVCEETELYKETKSFGNSLFIWNYLANFGGCTYQLAPLDKVGARLAEALKSPLCVGVGSTLEGISTYPIGYELTMEAPWFAEGRPDLKKWYTDYAKRRAGNDDPAVIKGWALLINQVLNKMQVGHYDRGTKITKRPEFKKDKSASVPKTALAGTPPPRPPQIVGDMVTAARKFLEASPETKQSDSYQYDLVNLTRQILSYEMDNVDTAMMDAFKRKEAKAFQEKSDKLLGMIRDLDTLLATRHEFLVGCWLEKARAFGNDPAQKDYYEKNARQLLSTWGPPGNGLTDYARREWNGMLKDYYLPRWQEYTQRLNESLAAGKEFEDKTFRKWCIEHEKNWSETTNTNYPAQEAGDPLKLVPSILNKYFPDQTEK